MNLKKGSSFFIVIFSLFISIPVLAEEKLVFVVDLIRHGDRTPLLSLPRSAFVWKEGLGELTAQGKDQEIKLGKALRKQYVYHDHLLPKLYQPSTVYVGSTPVRRTIMSADEFLIGLYPLNTRAKEDHPIPIHVFSNQEEKLLMAKPSKSLFSRVKDYLAYKWAWKKESKRLHGKLALWREQTGLPLNNFKQLDLLADELYIRQLHHIPLPQGMSSQDAHEIMSLGESNIIRKFKSKEASYPMGQAFLNMINHYLTLAAEQKTTLKYVLLSGHDSSIMSVMTRLQSPLEHIPPYASHLNFSLFKNGSEYTVKVSYNSQPVTLPGCERYRCRLSQWNSVVRDVQH